MVTNYQSQNVPAGPATPWTGTNLWVNLLLLVGSVFGGLSGDLATQIVAALLGIVGAFFALRNWIVKAKFSAGKGWLTDPNTWTYLTAVLVAIAPKAADLIPQLRGLVEALYSGNWGSIITAAITLVSLIYYTFFRPKPGTPTAPTVTTTQPTVPGDKWNPK